MDLEITGIKDADLIKEPDIEHGLDSWVYRSGDNCLIVKPLHNNGQHSEARGLKNAIEKSKVFGKYVLESSIVIAQGSINGEDVPLVVKVIPWFDDVICVSEIDPIDVLKDKELVSALCEIYRLGFEQVVNGKHFDLLRPSNRQSNIVLKAIMCMFSKNIMVGKDPATGEREIFIDNDACNDVSEKTLKRIGYSSLYLKNSILYELLQKINR